MISFRLFFKSIRYAWRGICDVARAEQSFRIQLVASGGVLFCMAVIPLAPWERMLLVLLMMSVLILEIINSTLERLADAVHPRMHPTVREMKDMMAGAVLLATLTAVCVGSMIVFPSLFKLFCASSPQEMWHTWCA